MNDLFDHNDRYTAQANILCRQVVTALKPIIKEWADAGYSSRDIQGVVMDAAFDACIEHRLDSNKKQHHFCAYEDCDADVDNEGDMCPHHAAGGF